MPPRPKVASTLRAGSYGAGTHSLLPRSGDMHVITDGGATSSTVDPHWITTPSTHPRHDFTWKPSQGIKFQAPPIPRSRPTKVIPRKILTPPTIPLPIWSALPVDSTAKVRRVETSGPLMRRSARNPGCRRVLTTATGQHQDTDEPGPNIELGHNSSARTALSEAQVEKPPRHGQTWWEPISFHTTVAHTVVSKISSETHATEGKQSVTHSTGRLQVARKVASRSSNNLEEPKQRKSRRARNSSAINRYPRKKKTDATPEADCETPTETLHQKYSAISGTLSEGPYVRIREELREAETIPDETGFATRRAELQNNIYRRFKRPFGRVIAGYDGLIKRFQSAIRHCPRLERMFTHMVTEVTMMEQEIFSEGHLYRVPVRLRLVKESGGVTEIGGMRRTSSAWRRSMREFYLYYPFREQTIDTQLNLQTLWFINDLRRHIGLRRLYGGGRLADSSMALDEAGREFVALILKRDALMGDKTEKELRRKLGPSDTVIRALIDLMRELRSLIYFWKRTCTFHPAFSSHIRRPSTRRRASRLHREFSKYSRILADDFDKFKRALNEAEAAVEDRILQRPTKSPVEQTSSLSEKAEVLIRSSQQSYQPYQHTLHLHATAPLSNAQFGGTSLLQSTPESLSDLVEIQSAGTSDGEQHSIQCAFEIPEDSRKETLAASTSGNIYWQYNLYQGPAGERVKVHYCRNKESSDRIAKLFLDKSVVGFDIEWKPQASAAEGTKKNVSLVQLASEERIALFHIARFGKAGNINDLVPPNLKRVMETPDITKVGVAVKADCTRLRNFMGIESRGLLELSHLYKLIKFSSCDVKKINKSLVSLAQQVEEHLLLPMWKGEVRSSDWSEELNFQQIQYAASDSYAGLQLYHAMEAKRKAIEPTPPCPAHAELNLPIRLANGQTVATYNEPEEAEDETSPTEPITNNDVLPEVEQMARDFLNITIEDVRQNKITTGTKPKRAPKPSPQKAPEITAAEAWVAAWRTNLPGTYKAKAMPAYMRAYAVWHDQGFGVQETASLLRDPPLQVTTVSNYILEAIRMEKLAYDAERLKEVLGHLPEAVVKSRYQSLRRQLE